MIIIILKEMWLVFSPSNKINKSINIHELMKCYNMKYHFWISNTDKSNQPWTQWLSIWGIYPKNVIFLFDSFEVLDLKNFVISDDSKIINKILFALDKFKL